MLKHRLPSSVAPSWEACIKALFRSYLPAKFALTGCLSLNDITKNGFYVIQKSIYPFPILDQLFTMNMDPAQTIYICNLAHNQSRPLANGNQEVKEDYSKSEGELERNATVPKIAAKNNIFSAYGPDVTKAIRSEQHEKLDFDPFLCELVKRFKCMVIAKESKDVYDQQQLGLVNFQYVKSRAKMLGEFVAHQLSGPDPTTKCIDHQLELHLNEIKHDLGTNIIPLGQLRVGSYLERALLFKVIADTICLPAALVRGGYGKTWIEIALPEIEAQNDQESLNSFANRDADTGKHHISSSRFFDRRISSGNGHQSFENPIKESVSITKHTSSIYPTKLLRPNYIVDLIYEPGKLIPLETKEADQYCSYRSYF
ncbi:uncharacterized protein LOC125500360 [Athalia rosae]|uniref:uncharacterized protein LOC125500360 n=1 Tax=Athalia rosae TaxID=37344 RepID=UPI0020331EEA|nr:uncharacterized protein LOC125500360 [Athalia rosae]